MSSEKTIAVFDSGFGGLSVLTQACRRHPEVSYLYYADTDHVPYGLKSNEEILRFSDTAVSFLIDQGADAVIMACNTASAVAAQKLRAKYDLPIIAMEPAVRPAIHEGNSARVLVMATPVTLREEKLKNLIHREHAEDRIDLLPMPGLVVFAEREEFDSADVRDYIMQNLSAFPLEEYTAIVLGCTHFNYFRPLLQTLLNETCHLPIHLIEGSEGTVRRAESLLHLSAPAEQMSESCCGKILSGASADLPTVRFFRSGREVTDPEDLQHIERLLQQLQKS